MRNALPLVAILVLESGSVAAQETPPDCDGDVTIVRVSQIKPEGSVGGFMKAVEAHRAWYRAQGVDDNEIVIAPMIRRDDATGEMTYVEEQFLSFHVRPPFERALPGRGDPGYDAFVKLYRENSEIAHEYLACVPRPTRASQWFPGERSRYWGSERDRYPSNARGEPRSYQGEGGGRLPASDPSPPSN
jgi:hypothetical protein